MAVANEGAAKADTDPTPVAVANEEAVTDPIPGAVENEEAVTDPTTVTFSNRSRTRQASWRCCSTSNI